MDLKVFAAYKAAVASGDKAGAFRLEAELLKGELGLLKVCLGPARRSNFCDGPDLGQAARIGILRALRGFDPARGKWSTYVRQWISAEINRGVVEERPVMHAVSKWKKILPKNVRREERAIQVRHGRPATAEELGVSEKDLEEYRMRSQTSGWTDMRVAGFIEQLSVEASEETLMKSLWKALGVLTVFEHRIVLAKIVEEKAHREIAAEEGLKEEAVRIAYNNAIAKVRAALRA